MKDNKNLESRIHSLEQRVSTLENRAFGMSQQKESETIRFEEKHVPKAPSGPTWIGDLFRWLREDWLMKLGAFMLILAGAWFVTYAFANNWIGPVGRISLGILFGAALLGAGHYTIPKKRVPGEVLVVTGMTSILCTVFAARIFYDFFTSVTALGIMLLVVSLATFVAIMRDSKPIAICSVLGAAIVPVLLDGLPEPWVLLLYVLIVNVGVLIVSYFKGWRSLSAISVLFTALYGTITFFELHGDDNLSVWIFMGIYYFFFLLTNIASIWRTKKSDSSDLFVGGITSLLALGWVSAFVPDHWQSIVLSALAVVSILSVFLMLRRSGDLKKNIYIYAATALTFVVAATAFELKEYDAALIAALSVEITLGTLFALKAMKDDKAAVTVASLHAIPILLLVSSGAFEYSSWVNAPIVNGHMVGMLFVIMSLYITAYFLAHRAYTALLVLSATASILAVLFVWFSLFNIIYNPDIARGVALILYTIIGVTLLYRSYKDNLSHLRIGSSILLGGVILRLFFVEFWEMPIAGKVITSFLVGGLLIATAFFNKKLIKK